MHASLEDGRACRLFDVIDDVNREGPGIEPGFSLPAERVIRVLEQRIDGCGQPQALYGDNGPDDVSAALTTRAERRGIRLEYIQPGKPQQNACTERCHRTVRFHWSGQHLFASIAEEREYATRRHWAYNHERLNMALGSITAKQKLAFVTRRSLLASANNEGIAVGVLQDRPRIPPDARPTDEHPGGPFHNLTSLPVLAAHAVMFLAVHAGLPTCAENRTNGTIRSRLRAVRDTWLGCRRW